jgi:hypothetical protein
MLGLISFARCQNAVKLYFTYFVVRLLTIRWVGGGGGYEIESPGGWLAHRTGELKKSFDFECSMLILICLYVHLFTCIHA